mmetsp:Transcript_152234/g.291619  ORF Transcript_152234/g.291619 Transcript_152234/m.291619 type:complete len:427 (-) Transcript_152234:174-1454(-)
MTALRPFLDQTGTPFNQGEERSTLGLKIPLIGEVLAAFTGWDVDWEAVYILGAESTRLDLQKKIKADLLKIMMPEYVLGLLCAPLGFMNWMKTAYATQVTFLFVSVWLQSTIVKQIKAWFPAYLQSGDDAGANKPPEPPKPPTDDWMDDWGGVQECYQIGTTGEAVGIKRRVDVDVDAMRCHAEPAKLFGRELPITTLHFALISNLPTFMQPLSTGTTVGQAFRLWSPKMKHLWQASWTPGLLGGLIGAVSLPVCLLTVVVVGWVCSIGMFVRYMYYSKATAFPDQLKHAADSTNLLLVSQTVTPACPPGRVKNRVVRFFVKIVLGSVPQLYLKVSLYGCEFLPMHPIDHVNMMFAMLCSFYSIVQMAPMAFGVARGSIKTRNFVEYLLAVLGLFFAVPMTCFCAARLLGVMVCRGPWGFTTGCVQ